MADKKKLKIKIFDKEYSLLVDNEEITKDLVHYVEGVMSETQRELPGQNAQTVAVIASLNIAYDLFLERERQKEFTVEAEERIKRIKLLIDQSQPTVSS
ncbi:MAG: cell division protein ZapA [Ignavibacteriaceae bacterium]|nr:cell division protein ZapA [Ignavibacteriaceae bacterium]